MDSNEQKSATIIDLPDLDKMKPREAEEAIQGMINGNNSPEDLAAAFFTMEYPKYVAMVHALSKNELIRMCINLAGHEFVPEKNRLKTDKERKTFYLGNQMVHNRAIMQLSFEMQKVEEANKREMEKQQNKGEEENGKEQTS